MKITIPKDLLGIQDDRILTINLNGFDIDLFLPALFFTIMAGGAATGTRVNDPTIIAQYIGRLAAHPDIQGFDGEAGERLLERLVRTELVVMGRQGLGRRTEQILAVTPYTLLAYKTGFPKERTRQRGVDAFLYHVLLSTLRTGSRFDDEKTLRMSLEQVFGKGLTIGSPPLLKGTYDGITTLDILTRLSIAFLDGLQSTPVGRQSGKRQPRAGCPALAEALGNDIRGYLFRYGDAMPTQAFTYNLQALINFELFIYTLKLVHAINELVREPSRLPAAMGDDDEVSHPQIYLDFTATPGSKSQEMARSCVRRDVEAYQQFYYSNLLLRQLDGYVDQLRRVPARGAQIETALDGATDGPAYLQGILRLRYDAGINMQIESRAATDESRIWQASVAEDGEEDGLLRARLDEITAGAESDLERIVSILAECQRKSALEHYMQWYWSVGGLTKPHGILAGALKGRSGWRYAPSNDLLAVLVQLAAISISRGEEREARDAQHPQPIRLQDFLGFLERRFGILVDRPPEPFAGAEAAAAARENLRAMLRRLQQMGIFSDLSDDFTVQRLQPPYGRDQHARMEA